MRTLISSLRHTAVSRAVISVLVATLALTACGGGGESADAAPARIVATTGNDGWQIGVLGVNAGDVQALSIDGHDYMPTMRKMAADGAGHFFDASDEDGKAFYFSSMNQPSADGLPLTGQVTVTTTEGAISFPLAFTTGQDVEATDIDADGRAFAMKVDWKAIWKSALKKAKKGTPNAIIKEYLRSKGYYCPPGPWWLCARPVS